MSENTLLSLEQFLDAPVEKVATVAPSCMIYPVSGTRRSAALAGIAQNNSYIAWSRQQMLACTSLIFQHGVRHILMPMVTPSQFNEITPAYRENLWGWLDKYLASPAAIAEYQALGWRVNIAFSSYLPKLDAANQRLEAAQYSQSCPTLWVFIIPEHNILMQWALDIIAQTSPKTPKDAIQSIYGEAIPPATLFLDFGKPVVSPDLLPPFLVGKLNCYWTQRPGYSLDKTQFRKILYDYAYVRTTWKEDKTGRAEEALAYRNAWENGPILGLGKRLGPFWYPEPMEIPSAKG